MKNLKTKKLSRKEKMMELNEIYLGDAYKLIKEVPDKSVDLIVTDPPYQIDGLHKDTGILKGRKNSHNTQLLENNLGDGIDLKILDEFVRVLKKINIYIWCNKEQLYDYMTYFVKERKCNFEIIVWAKPNPAPFTNGHYLKDKEYCLFFWEKGVKVGGNYHSLKTYYVKGTNKDDKDNYLHPTCKPIDIIENLIKNSTSSSQVERSETQRERERESSCSRSIRGKWNNLSRCKTSWT